jgi:hypothetical protein
VKIGDEVIDEKEILSRIDENLCREVQSSEFRVQIKKLDILSFWEITHEIIPIEMSLMRKSFFHQPIHSFPYIGK